MATANRADHSAPLLHEIPEAAAVLGIGRSKLYELIRTGQLETVRIGARRLVPHDALVQLARTGAR